MDDEYSIMGGAFDDDVSMIETMSSSTDDDLSMVEEVAADAMEEEKESESVADDTPEAAEVVVEKTCRSEPSGPSLIAHTETENDTPTAEPTHESDTLQANATKEDANDAERKFRSDLNELLQYIEVAVESEATTPSEQSDSNVFGRMHTLASNAHKSLVTYGRSVELALSSPDDPMTNSDGEVSAGIISDTSRESLRNTGAKLWKKIRSHPSWFHDKVKVGTNTDKATRDKAAASGYIRAITARLVLIDYIQTKSASDEVETAKLATLESAGPEQLAYGLRCFCRAGRALLDHGSDASAAFPTLGLATRFWQAIVARDNKKSNGTASADESLITKHLDEAFEAVALLPDAAARVAQASTTTEVSDAHCGQILSLLKNLEEFVLQYCLEGKDTEASGPAISKAIQRYLPALAGTSYKHGNTFSRRKQYTFAHRSLRISLEATNRFLACIAVHASSGNKGVDFSRQQHEMLMVSKQCLYVLSHIQHALGKSNEAQKCLDRLEHYIEEENRLQEKTYAATMKQLNASDAVMESQDGMMHSYSESLSIEGPRQQSVAEGRARAKAARDKGRLREHAERSNVAFSRIMIDNRSDPSPTQDEEERIDTNLKQLAEQSKKCHDLLEQNCHSSVPKDPRGLEKDESFKRALDAARMVGVRRLLSFAQHGNIAVLNKSNPYSILLSVFSDCHPLHIFVVLDHLNALLISIQKAYETTPQLPTDALEKLDAFAVDVGRDLAALLTKAGENAVATRNNSTLFTDSDSGMESVLDESQAHFARALSFYRSRDAYKSCVTWADFFLQALRGSTPKLASTPSEGRSNNNQYEAVANAMSIKAYAMSMMNENKEESCKAARDAWDIMPTLSSLSVLFHCRVIAESNSNAPEILAELETGLTRLSSTASRGEMLSLFPVLNNVCYENGEKDGGPLTLGIQKMWIDLFIANGFVKEGVVVEHSDVPLFPILAGYLTNIEKLWTDCSRDAAEFSVDESGKGLIATLSKVLDSLLTLRDSNTCEMQTSGSSENQSLTDGSLVDSVDALPLWDDKNISLLVGEKRDCQVIAEQLWNLALIPHPTEEVPSELFCKAHDFAIFAKEPVGGSLSKCRLDCELDSDSLDDFETFTSLVDVEKIREPSMACSYFSVECLVMSVAKVIDNAKPTNEEDSSDSTRDRLLRRSLVNIYIAKQELTVTASEDDHASVFAGMLSWLELRCLVEIGDDQFCSKTLLHDDVLLRLSSIRSESTSKTTSKSVADDSSTGNPDDAGAVQEPLRTFGTHSIASCVFAVSLRAKTKRMPMSEKLILQKCVDDLINHSKSSIMANDGSRRSLGKIQQRLVRLADGAHEIAEVLGGVDSFFKDNEVDRSNEDDKNHLYTTEEIDWFAIEAYNWGLNMLHYEDLGSSEKLLVIALNLLPRCSEQVKFYAEDMHAAYTTLLSKDAVVPSLSSEQPTTALVTQLFGNGM